ncbi:imidazole glycerol phosphate synthase subunit HisH [Pseudoalteromonas sp. NBT06-2]|uniref:imidazole glycerol phosphate synthase subunit HisH n=1 Tax=Pseudoalteromonas sp. NBT06-2 TaxID=2025950 RepID=UPI000BA5B717|nr:imidazole glycerol phosphate synthase subunit HisH [Pseudoalteromonas sp. NBT06-2]PAJ76349.1 imidazole glycerol phosphate synthase subunit HisH [Pseudoalteromonas sp. NBT06-2]
MLAIIDTGCANINSVRFAFERLGVTPKVITNVDQVQSAERIILPGVGHASVAMDRLISGNWLDAINEFERPIMGICLGMQLLCEQSSEGNIKTLNKIKGNVSQLDVGQLTSPHMGWNNLNVLKPHALTKGITSEDQVYFVHSFAHQINECTFATTKYGQSFSAIIAQDNIAGMQFHPERSAKVGARLLQNFLDWQI